MEKSGSKPARSTRTLFVGKTWREEFWCGSRDMYHLPSGLPSIAECHCGRCLNKLILVILINLGQKSVGQWQHSHTHTFSNDKGYAPLKGSDKSENRGRCVRNTRLTRKSEDCASKGGVRLSVCQAMRTPTPPLLASNFQLFMDICYSQLNSRFNYLRISVQLKINQNPIVAKSKQSDFAP